MNAEAAAALFVPRYIFFFLARKPNRDVCSEFSNACTAFTSCDGTSTVLPTLGGKKKQKAKHGGQLPQLLF